MASIKDILKSGGLSIIAKPKKNDDEKVAES